MPDVYLHWASKYVGTPYSEYDCAELAVHVLHEQFGREINLPTTRGAGVRGISNQISDLQSDFADETSEPAEGDAVLMRSRGRINHIGIYCYANGEPSVLHAMRNTGCTCLHKLRELQNLGLVLEGFYRWK